MSTSVNNQKLSVFRSAVGNERTYQPDGFVGVNENLEVDVGKLEGVTAAAGVSDHGSASRRVRAKRRRNFP